MDHFCLIPRSLVQASLVAVALSAGAAHAEDISLTPPAGGGFVIKDKASSAERFRVQDNGDAFVPGLANTPNTGTAMLCFDSGTGRLIQCAPGTGTGTGAQGPAGADSTVPGPTGAKGDKGDDILIGGEGHTSQGGAARTNIDIHALVKLAQQLYDSAQEAQRQGNWALYGEKIKELGNVISEIEERTKK